MERIAVIGGGVAGMSCAAALAECGLRPMIIERGLRLGGRTADWHRLAPDFRSADAIVGDLIERIASLDVEVLLGVEAVDWSTRSVTLLSGEVIDADAVVVCTGIELFDARRKEEYGYGLYRGVITTADLEMLLRQGRAAEFLARPKIRRAALLHCVGSRDAGINSLHCSRMCCITAVKQAIELRVLLPEAEIYDFYMDMRCFGAGYEELYYSAQIDHLINFIRGRISEAAALPDGRIAIKAEDTLLSLPVRMSVDLLVLAVGVKPSRFADGAGGVYVAGAASSPKSVEESINDGVAKAHCIIARARGYGG